MKRTFTLLHKQTDIEWNPTLGFETVRQNDVAIVDKNVWHLYKEKLEHVFAIKQVYLFIAKEENKSLTELSIFFNWLADKKFTRNDSLWAIGGGITTDFAGFAASVYKRGCKLKLIPTTLLAMVDAALGGKTALNFGKNKNAIGSFYPAEKVYISSEWLIKLSKEEMNNGLVEMIKTSLLQPNDLYSSLLKADGYPNDTMIMQTALMKMKYCEVDPEDIGMRRFLNLGHTFAHVLESASNYEIPHGKCVLKGIKAAVKFSLKTRYITTEIAGKILQPFQELQLDFIPGKKIKISSECFFQDKKTTDSINLILFNGFQSVFIYPTQQTHLLKEVLEEILYEKI
jgi:3-dehydroquinate synthetase